MRQFGTAREIFKTLFMSDHDLLIFFNMSEQFLAPGGLSAECAGMAPLEANSRSIPGLSRKDDILINQLKTGKTPVVRQKAEVNKNMRQFGVAHEI